MDRRDFVRGMCLGGLATFAAPLVTFAQVPGRGRLVFVLLPGGPFHRRRHPEQPRHGTRAQRTIEGVVYPERVPLPAAKVIMFTEIL